MSRSKLPRMSPSSGPMPPLLVAAVAVLGMSPAGAMAGLDWLSPELRRIEQERQTSQQELATLPPAPTAEVTQRLGWHSDYSAAPDTVEWVELNLGHAERLDAVVLIAPSP